MVCALRFDLFSHGKSCCPLLEQEAAGRQLWGKSTLFDGNDPMTRMVCRIMKTAHFSLGIAAVLLWVAAAAAQTSTGSSLEQIKTDRQQLAEFEKLNTADKKKMFCALPNAAKRELLMQLPDKEKQLVFDCLMSEDKTWVLEQLTPRQIAALFMGLDDIEQRMVFSKLDEENKLFLLDQMSDREKNKWVLIYPELEALLAEPEMTEKEEVAPDDGQLPMQREPSQIERVLSGAFPLKIDRQLEQFGYDIFEGRAASRTPPENAPVSDDYVIGPGDRLTIYLWGNVEHAYPVSVKRDGSVTIPRVGNLVIGGMSLAKTKTFLRNKFKTFYPDFEMNVIMDKLRSIHIYIVGEAVNPGAYTLNALSTVMSALSVSGGPSKKGSLRKIRVLRSGGEQVGIDLYDIFVAGEKARDIRLRAGDTIFIPVIGPVVGVAGNVRRPAIYELRGGETIEEILELAGNVMPFGYLQNVVVERIEANQRRVIKSFNLGTDSDASREQLQSKVLDGDVVKIYPVHRQVDQVVYLEGHVKYAREYEHRDGMRLSDILTGYQDLLPEPYLPRAEIVRLIKPDLHPSIIEFDLGALLSGDVSQDLVLEDRDRIKIYSYSEKVEVPTVSIEGAVNAPGLYRLYRKMTVRDLIFRAGNLARRAYAAEAALTRIVPGESKTETIEIMFSPQKAMDGTRPDDLELKPNDSIYIREIPQYELAGQRSVTLEGEFMFAGDYSFADGERISSVIRRAGGLTEFAYPFGAVFMREDVKTIQGERLKDYIDSLEEDILTLTAKTSQASLDSDESEIIAKTLSAKSQLIEKMKRSKPTGRMVLDLERLLAQPNSAYDLKLEPGDRLIVGKKPDFVNVLGEVYNSTAMTALPDKRVGYYLDKVGGPNDDADKKQIYLVRANGTVISKRQEGFFGISSWDSDQQRWTSGGFNSLAVYPGDAIIVPKKVDQYAWLRLTKSVTQILYQIAVAAGVLVVAF
jgi:polysaccharide export outer membrane protein